jgi:gliding motility-associated-like protein
MMQSQRCMRAVMLGIVLALLAGRGYGMPAGSGGLPVGAAVLTIRANTMPATCGNANGSISIAVTGGTAPYLISFNGGPFLATNTFPNLAGGVYSIDVEDAAVPMNTGSVPVGIGDIAGPSAFLQPIAATCLNNDGEIDVIVTAGTPPFLFSVNGGPFGAGNLVGGLSSGNQSVTIKDNNGCLVTQSTNIPLTDNLTLAMGPGATICQGTGAPLTLTTNATGFSWTPTAGLNNPGLAQPVASPGTTTAYTVNVTLGVCTTTGLPETITVLPAPQPTAAAVAPICHGQSTQLQGGGGGGITYQWLPATYLSSTTILNPVVQKPQQTITYALTVTDANGCKSIEPAVVQVVVTPIPDVFAGDDTAILIGQDLPLNAVDVNNSGFTSYQWLPAIGLNSSSIQDPVATVTGDITYTVTAKTPAGCEGAASIKILAVTMSDIVVPNAFTPNGDGHNDVVRPHLIGIKDFKSFRVFNRWGQQVFFSANEGAGWDGMVGGQVQPLGTYVWVAVGMDFSGKVVERRGTVILVR